MKSILYLGTKTSNFKKMSTAMESLEPLLGEFCNINTASHFRSQWKRIFHMVYFFLKYGFSSDKILIDMFSTKAFYYSLFFSIMSKITGRKAILILRGGGLPAREKNNPLLTGLALNCASQIVAPSKYLAEYFILKGYKVILIPNIITLNDYKFKERFNVNPHILALRGFDKNYNPLMTLKAVYILNKEFPNIKLSMLGNKEDSCFLDVCNFIKDFKMESIVEIRNKMPKLDWISFSENFDIMVSNPEIDNTPISIIEGMALGMCVVSTNVGGVPYLVSEQECCLVGLNDHNELAEKISFILKNPDYAQKLSINGRKKAEEFDWKSVRYLWKNLIENEN